MNIDEMKDRIARAEEIQRYTENRCEALEKENAELKEVIDNDVDKKIYVQLAKKAELADIQKDQLTNAKEIIKRLLATPRSIYGRDEDGEITSFFNSDYEELKKQAEQFLKDCDIDNAIQQANKGLDFDKIADEMEQDLKDSEVEK